MEAATIGRPKRADARMPEPDERDLPRFWILHGDMMDNHWVHAAADHRERREQAYRRAAETHRRAEAAELRAAKFFEGLGDEAASAQHAANAAAQRTAAEADNTRADAAAADGLA